MFCSIVSCVLLLVTLSAESFAGPIILADLSGCECRCEHQPSPEHATKRARVLDSSTSELQGRNQQRQHHRPDCQHHSSRATGDPKGPPASGRFSLEESREARSRGGGPGMWSFADGALHFTRTFPSGAYRAHFTFAHGEGGITCEVTLEHSPGSTAISR